MIPNRYFSDSAASLTDALRDLAAGFARGPLWARLAWLDIQLRYRGSVLGPFWLTLSMAITVMALGFVYSRLFNLPAHDYVPFLATGLILWGLVSSLVTEGCNTFLQAERFIKQVRLPLSTYVYRALCRIFLVFLHNMAVYVVVALLFGLWAGPMLLVAIPGLLFIFLNGAWVMILLGMICARFRDIAQIVSSLTQVIFFITPVLWKPKLLEGHEWILQMNPLHHFMDVVRSPLLGEMPELLSWKVVVVITALGWLATLAFLQRFRRRLAYWV